MQGLLENGFVPATEEPCFDFCKYARKLLGRDTPDHLSGMRESERINVGAVVLFLMGEVWHTGVLWPDSLHFVHLQQCTKGSYFVSKESLTMSPWKYAITGFYDV